MKTHDYRDHTLRWGHNINTLRDSYKVDEDPFWRTDVIGVGAVNKDDLLLITQTASGKEVVYSMTKFRHSHADVWFATLRYHSLPDGSEPAFLPVEVTQVSTIRTLVNYATSLVRD